MANRILRRTRFTTRKVWLGTFRACRGGHVKRWLIKTADGRELIVYAETGEAAKRKLAGQKLYTLNGMVDPSAVLSVAHVGEWSDGQLKNDLLQVTCIDNQYEFAALQKKTQS